MIRAFSTEKYEEKRFDAANIDLTKTSLFVNRAMTFMMPTMMFIMNGISVLIVWNGAHGISDGQMQVGDMMAFIQYMMQIIMGFLMICMISIMLPRAAVSADRIEEILTSKSVIEDPKEAAEFQKSEKGVLKFEHVSFRIRERTKMCFTISILQQSRERLQRSLEVPEAENLRWLI